MGDTLVVETAGNNGKAWLDTNGHPVTDALKVTERFHRKDFGHMDLQITDRRSEGLYEAVDRYREPGAAAR